MLAVILDNWPGQLIQFGFIPFSGSEEDFQKCKIFHQSEFMAAIFGRRAMSLDTIEEENHPMNITSMFGPIWLSGSWEED
jgi:hypothetical protein